MGRYESVTTDELLSLCTAADDSEAWEEFVARFHRLIASVVVRVSMLSGQSNRQTIDDLIQETYLKLCADKFRLIRSFDARHPEAFFGYIKVITANVVRDYFRSIHSQRRGVQHLQDLPESFVALAPEDSAGSPKSIERQLLIAEIRRYLEICTTGPEQDRNCRIFWLYYRAGLPASAISVLPGINLTTKGVESLILRITREVRAHISVPKRKDDARTLTVDEGILPTDSF